MLVLCVLPRQHRRKKTVGVVYSRAEFEEAAGGKRDFMPGQQFAGVGDAEFGMAREEGIYDVFVFFAQ